jgi:SAM-dependent methyltransferase
MWQNRVLSNPRLKYLKQSIVKELEWFPKDVRFRFDHRHDKMRPIPGPYLRFRVAGDYAISWFHASGRESRVAFERALEGTGRDLSAFRSILDFGSGCGRILRWLDDLTPRARLFGVDVDGPAVRWCKRHLPYALVQKTSPLPPLPFADGAFDLIYSHSVFTHLDETYQDRWLAELRRVLMDGGILLATVNGERPWRGFFDTNPGHPGMIAYRQRLTDTGFLFVSDDNWKGIFPDFYHSTFHTKQYVHEHWGRHFEIRGYHECAMLDLQDIVVLEKRAEGGRRQ